jgi:hypothetical protein
VAFAVKVVALTRLDNAGSSTHARVGLGTGITPNVAHMNQSISEIQRLLQQIADHLKSGTKMDTRKAVTKLQRIAALASTLALTIRVQR